jgi:hypothetical protein
VDGSFAVSAEGLEVLDEPSSAGRYLFLERFEREPFSGGVALTGLLRAITD